MLDTKTVQKNQSFPINKVQFGVFDVRENGAIRVSKVDELVAQESIGLRPGITVDGVPIYGRHGLSALARLEGVNGALSDVVHVDIYPNIRFSKLSAAELAELRLFAMKYDMGEIRDVLVQADLEYNIKELLKNGCSPKQIIESLTSKYVSKSRLGRLIYGAQQSILQKKLAIAANEAKKKLASGQPVNLENICKKNDIDPIHASKLLRTPHQKNSVSKKTYKSMLAKQKALKKAAKILEGYFDNNLRDVRDGIMDKAVAVRLANAQIARVEDILHAAKEGLVRVESQK